ncbi:MAG: hypothetical protein V9E94_07310 [Microthrixaceae bacterium]
MAAGEANATRSVFQAIHDGRPTNDLLAIRYMDALKGIADGRASKIYLPLDTGGLYGSLAGVAELFKGAGEPSAAEADFPLPPPPSAPGFRAVPDATPPPT